MARNPPDIEIGIDQKGKIQPSTGRRAIADRPTAASPWLVFTFYTPDVALKGCLKTIALDDTASKSSSTTSSR
jgi:hypothetical protein